MHSNDIRNEQACVHPLHCYLYLCQDHGLSPGVDAPASLLTLLKVGTPLTRTPIIWRFNTYLYADHVST